jgi:hypothetical protein
MTRDVVISSDTAHIHIERFIKEGAMQYGLSLTNGGVCGDARALARIRG